jgi:CheY-specific phosphatase CheX
MRAAQGPAVVTAVEDARAHEPRTTAELANVIATNTVGTFGHLELNIDFTSAPIKARPRLMGHARQS